MLFALTGIHLEDFMLTEINQRKTYCMTGVPNLWDLVPDDLRWSWCNNNIKCTVNGMHLNHPETNLPHPTLSMEKLSSTKLLPGAKKAGDCSFKPVNSCSFIIAATGNEYGIKICQLHSPSLIFHLPNWSTTKDLSPCLQGKLAGVWGKSPTPSCPKALGYPSGGAGATQKMSFV